MTLRNSWIYAGRSEEPLDDMPGRIVTTGMSDNDTENGMVFFAQALREDDGTYTVSYARRMGRQGYDYDPGPWRLTLCEALEVLEEWQRRHRSFYTYAGLDIGLREELADDARHFSEVAKDLGVALGPEAVSLRHAEAAKRTALGHYRKKPPR